MTLGSKAPIPSPSHGLERPITIKLCRELGRLLLFDDRTGRRCVIQAGVDRSLLSVFHFPDRDDSREQAKRPENDIDDRRVEGREFTIRKDVSGLIAFD